MGSAQCAKQGIGNALLREGVSADRIKVIRYGKERPFGSTAKNDDAPSRVAGRTSSSRPGSRAQN